MKTEAKRKTAMICALALVVLAIVSRIYLLIKNFGSDSTTTYVVASFSIIALIFACVYIGTEFKKSSAKYFKFFLCSFILTQLAFVLDFIIKGETLAVIIITLFVFGLLNILLGIKDLERYNSLLLSGFILFLNILLLIVYSIQISKEIGSVTWLVALVIGLTPISLSVVLLIMMVLKYYDKRIRKEQVNKENN